MIRLQFTTPEECLTALSIKQFETSPFVLYPNPTSNIVNLKGEFDNWILNNSTGKQLKKWQVSPRKGSRPKSAVVYDVAFTKDGKSLITESSSGLSETWTIPKNLK